MAPAKSRNAGRVVLQSAPGDLERALERAGDGAFVTGGDGRIILWNHAAEQVLGYAADEVMGKPCCVVLAGCDQDGNRLCHPRCQRRTLFTEEEPVRSFDVQARTRAHGHVWINVSVLGLPTAASGQDAIVHLFRDVTATRNLGQVLRDHQTEAPPLEPNIEENALSRRQVQILKLLSAGSNTKDVARQLHVSTATVRNHVQNILGKLGVHSRLQAVAVAHRHRWV